jgi:hypothetical protein
MFRLKRARASAVKNRKPQNFLRLISLIISYPVIITRCLTHPAKAGNQKLGESSLLVPGQSLSAPLPNHIKLNTESGELIWHTASDTWMREDGLYDHLVLKLDKD